MATKKKTPDDELAERLREASESETSVAVDETKTPEEQAILDLVELTGKLTPAQQEALAQLGFVIPTGDIASALKGDYDLGYWCCYCNQIALYFVGKTWNGTQYELKGTRTIREIPPLGVSIDKISWTQTGKKAAEINRNRPACQHCSQVVQLGANRTLRPSYIRDVKKFEIARDKSHSRAEVLKHMREVGAAESVGGLSSNYDNPKTMPSQFMTEDQKAEVTAIADAYDPFQVVRK